MAGSLPKVIEHQFIHHGLNLQNPLEIISNNKLFLFNISCARFGPITMTSSWKWPIVTECVREGLQVSVCTDLSPGLFAPNWTLSQHTDKDALWLIAFITFITCFTILISALYFTLPLSLTAGHWTLNISHRITIKLQIVWLPVASFSHEAPARSSFSVQNIRGRLKVICFGKKQGFYNSSKHSHMF